MNFQNSGVNLEREFMSFQAKAVIKTTEDYLQFGPSRLLHSAAVSEGSGLQDCSRHQTASDHSYNEISDPDSCKSNSKNNSCFISASKRNRPVSAPVGQLRVAELSSLKSKLDQNWHKLSQRHKLQPRVIRVTAYKNGSRTVFAKVTVPTITLLLKECTEKLNLNMAARRVFLADGTEALKPEDIPHEADVYVSTGEPFLDPFKKIKDHLLLMKKVTWTMNGLMFPTDIKRRKTKPVLSSRMKKLTEKTSARILFFKNGMGQDGHEITVGKETMKKVLDICTMRMNLNSPARYLYDLYGRKIKDISKVPLLEKCLQNSITPLRGPVWVSKGEGFSPSGAKMYIQGVLLALYQRLKSAKKFYKQLNLAADEQKGKITEKVILSMTAKEHHQAQEEVNRLIDELQTAIKSHRGHLSKLGPQLQAEQEQFSSYVYQHIKSLPANTLIPGGLQLKIFESGKDTGEISVYISKKDLGPNNPSQTGHMMERLLLKIHQRLQGSSINPPSLNFSSARLFDEHGQEIKNPLLLKNEQKIWVSYGKAYRSPLHPVLGLTFDRVTAFARGGIIVAYKTFLDPNAVLLPGCDNWEICEGFPVNLNGTSQQMPDQFETVNSENHFLQNKADPNMVLHASVSIRKQSFSSSEESSGSQKAPLTLWPAASVWLITKTGMILSRAITQGCLAIGHPIRLKAAEGTSLEGYKLILQKRNKGDDSQKWIFGIDSCIYSKAYPQFVLTYLEELNAQVDVTQTEYHLHHGAWTAAHWEHGSSVAEEVLQSSASIPGLKQLPEPSDAHLMPEGSLGETGQLTVALVRKLEEKHPKASAQRWSIKHEGTGKPGQWKHSRVENPLWNKLTYMWPVLPSGQLNEEFDWPIEGLLLPNSPPMKKPICKTPKQYVPVRLRVLQNGDKNKTRALTIISPGKSPEQKMQNVDTERKGNVKNAYVTKYSETETNQAGFHQLLERCTEILNLPSAARRLFNEKGKEIFNLKDLQRDELVYVSCGEHWINPDLSIAQQKKPIFLRNLASDISKIHTFCSTHKIEALVLEVQSDIVAGAKLAVHKPVPGEEKQIIEPEEKQMQKNALTTENASSEILDSHARAHLRMKACHTLLRYAWQETSHNFDEDDSLPKKTEEELFENMELENKYSHSPKQSKLQKLRCQQFEYRDGQIISCAAPQLVLGVQSPNPHSGTEVVLVDKKADDSHQRWLHEEDSRTFHLVSNPDLVLAVSMTKSRDDACGYPVIAQKYKPYDNGTSNQKWNYLKNKKAFMAFHSTALDKEITAANYAGICTSSVIKEENIDQPGYYYVSPNGKRKIMLCLACGQSMRAEKGLKQLLPGQPFLCASGSKTQKPFSRGPFKVISVAKADLSSDEAENTLSYYEECLLSLRMKTCSQVVSHSSMAVIHQKAVKIIAYKNGDGYRNGKLIVAGTFPMLLTECTQQLGLARAASKVYTKDGTTILSLRDLVLWALDESFIQRDSEEKKKETAPDGTKETRVKNIEVNSRMKMKNKSFPKSVTSDSLDGIDKSLLTLILRNPIAIWVSCGEPFLSPNALQRAEKIGKQNWQKKDKILADLDTMKHKMRQLKGRRVAACQPTTMVPNKSPLQPVVVEGGWTEQTQEEIKLMDLIRHTEQAYLSEVQELQSKRNSPIAPKCRTLKKSSLYKQPNAKRVWVYLNGGRPEDGTFARGKTISELLDDCSSRLKLAHPARTLYTPEGEPIHSWDDIERDMVICVTTGHGFITPKELKQLVEVRANYARICRQQGPQATDIVLSPSAKLQSLASLKNTRELPSKELLI